MNRVLCYIIDNIILLCATQVLHIIAKTEKKKKLFTINAKHIPERERPFQCHECTRGFAQKAHLDKHLEVCHNIIRQQRKVSSVSYIVKLTEMSPRSTKTKARRQYYMKHKVINTNDINNNKHEYLPGVYLKKHDIHYDINKGFIDVNRCNLYKNINTHKIPKIHLRA